MSPVQQDPVAQDRNDWHETTLQIPFTSANHADIARRVISVDRQLNAHLVERILVVQGTTLTATYRAASVRLLRLAMNGFIENLQLVVRTIQGFAPLRKRSETVVGAGRVG